MCKLVPDGYFPTYRQLTPDYLISRGIRALVLDVDNTLAPYEQPDPDPALLSWLRDMRQSGVALAVVSNNHSDRIARFTRDFDFPIIAGASKPLPKSFKKATEILGLPPRSVAAIGDQIYTDVLAARWARFGLVVVVPPIRDKRDAFTRFKRLCERPVMRRLFRREGIAMPPKQNKKEKRSDHSDRT
ncbi:MAG: YqeG family HAD IIIA-type phosphatase [Clostridia bacterium]|nr:YqeG family HAD IIIA-type phosphatase [Clostridia bacterium]